MNRIIIRSERLGSGRMKYTAFSFGLARSMKLYVHTSGIYFKQCLKSWNACICVPWAQSRLAPLNKLPIYLICGTVLPNFEPWAYLVELRS